MNYTPHLPPHGGKGLPMKVELLIRARWFYKDDSQKTLLNWFLYDYALKLYEHIDGSRDRAVAKWRARLSDEQVAEFCAYYSKRMRLSILDRLEGNTDATVVYDEYITDYCHENTRRENEAIRRVGGAAWGELLDTCAICPTGCLGRITERCELFDRLGRGGRLS